MYTLTSENTVSRSREQSVTAALLIGVPVLFTAAFSLLSGRFDYPDILRRPAAEVLMRFHAQASGLLPLWWLMLLAALLFIPTAMLSAKACRLQGSALPLAIVAGSLAGLAQALGLARWTFLVPLLAERYAHTAETDPVRQTLILLFEAFHHYAGAAVGEWMGYLFTAAWTALLSAARGRQGARAASLIGYLSAAGIAVGMLEPFRIAGVGAVNALAYVLWSFWMIGQGITLLRSPSPN